MQAPAPTTEALARMVDSIIENLTFGVRWPMSTEETPLTNGKIQAHHFMAMKQLGELRVLLEQVKLNPPDKWENAPNYHPSGVPQGFPRS